MKLPPLHFMEERRSPVSVILTCACGWSTTVSRRQNALARSAKLRAARVNHLKDVAKDKS